METTDAPRPGSDEPPMFDVPPTAEAEGFVSVREAARETGINADTIRAWVKNEWVQSRRRKMSFGEQVEVITAEVDALGTKRGVTRTTAAGGPETESPTSAPESTPEAESEPKAGMDTLPIPVSLLEQMTASIGQLHGAGHAQGQAEARATFLAERTHELRTMLDASTSKAEHLQEQLTDALAEAAEQRARAERATPLTDEELSAAVRKPRAGLLARLFGE